MLGLGIHDLPFVQYTNWDMGEPIGFLFCNWDVYRKINWSNGLHEVLIIHWLRESLCRSEKELGAVGQKSWRGSVGKKYRKSEL